MEGPPKVAIDKNATKNYCSVLINPFDEHIDARIPDECTLPTRTTSLYYEGTFLCNAAGEGGVHLWINHIPANSRLLPETTSPAGGAFVFGPEIPLPGVASIVSLGSRAVAAGMKCQYAGSDLNNQGIVYAVSSNRFETAGAGTPVASVAAMSAARLNGFGPAKLGCYSVYRPIDNKDKEYATTTTSAGALQLHVTGATGGAVFIFKVVIHYELLPSVDTEAGSGEYARSQSIPYLSQLASYVENSTPVIGENTPNFLERQAGRVRNLAESATRATDAGMTALTAMSNAGSVAWNAGTSLKRAFDAPGGPVRRASQTYRYVKRQRRIMG